MNNKPANPYSIPEKLIKATKLTEMSARGLTKKTSAERNLPLQYFGTDGDYKKNDAINAHHTFIISFILKNKSEFLEFISNSSEMPIIKAIKLVNPNLSKENILNVIETNLIQGLNIFDAYNYWKEEVHKNTMLVDILDTAHNQIHGFNKGFDIKQVNRHDLSVFGTLDEQYSSGLDLFRAFWEHLTNRTTLEYDLKTTTGEKNFYDQNSYKNIETIVANMLATNTRKNNVLLALRELLQDLVAFKNNIKSAKNSRCKKDDLANIQESTIQQITHIDKLITHIDKLTHEVIQFLVKYGTGQYENGQNWIQAELHNALIHADKSMSLNQKIIRYYIDRHNTSKKLTSEQNQEAIECLINFLKKTAPDATTALAWIKDAFCKKSKDGILEYSDPIKELEQQIKKNEDYLKKNLSVAQCIKQKDERSQAEILKDRIEQLKPFLEALKQQAQKEKAQTAQNKKPQQKLQTGEAQKQNGKSQNPFEALGEEDTQNQNTTDPHIKIGKPNENQTSECHPQTAGRKRGGKKTKNQTPTTALETETPPTAPQNPTTTNQSDDFKKLSKQKPARSCEFSCTIL